MIVGRYLVKLTVLADFAALPAVTVMITQGDGSVGRGNDINEEVDLLSHFTAGVPFSYSVQLHAIASNPGNETSDGSVQFLGFFAPKFDIPEPGSLSLMAAGALGLIALWARRAVHGN
jgi:hypothetical protein